jgi:hypothetical protein
LLPTPDCAALRARRDIDRRTRTGSANRERADADGVSRASTAAWMIRFLPPPRRRFPPDKECYAVTMIPVNGRRFLDYMRGMRRSETL